MIRSSRRRPNRRKMDDRLTLESLEPRQLLAADLFTQHVDQPPQPTVGDPFAPDAVTVDQVVARTKTDSYVPGELLIALEIEADDTTVHTARASLWHDHLGQQLTQPPKTIMSFESSESTTFSLVHVNLGDDADLIREMRRLDGSSDVLWSQPNFLHRGPDPREYIPNDPRVGNQYHHGLINNYAAWDLTLGNADIIIGVTDDGVDLQHEDLAAAIWTNPGETAGDGIDNDNNGYIDDVNGYNFLNNNNNPDALSNDDHGTHVAGIAAGQIDNGIGIAGTAGGATIMPLKWYDGGTWTAALIAETFTYAADNGANIVNTSYRMDGWANDAVVHAAFDYMYDAGVLHFNSAGNGDTLNPPRQVFEKTLLVASVNSVDAKSGSSNYGTGIDLASPGDSVLSTTPNNTYSTFSGTSMASPNAAGVAALIWSAHPEWTREQVVAQLFSTTDNIDAQNSGFVGLLGRGRVNSGRGVTEDLPAPTVKTVSNIPDDGLATVTDMISEFDVLFSQHMDAVAVTDLATYDLRNAGPDGMFDTEDDQTLALDVSSDYFYGTNGVHVDITDGPLDLGQYRLSIASGGAQDPFGSPLDGNDDGIGGDNYEVFFNISIEPFVRTGVLAGLGSVSAGNLGSLGAASESDDYNFFVEAGESVTAVVRPSDPTVQLDAEFVGLSGVVSAAAPGEEVIIPLTPVAATGNVTLSVSGDNATAYTFDIYRNLNAEGLQESPTAVDLENSFLNLGSGRYAAIAQASGNVAGTQFIHSNNPGLFVDISGTGTALGLSDDQERTITTTVGNAAFQAGSVTVGNNGALVAAAGEDVPYSNGSLPRLAWGTALLPFWDDIDGSAGDVYWEETQINGINTLIVQWHNRPHYSNVDSATFQVQLFESGPVLARFAYQDIEFGDPQFDNGASATIGYQESPGSAIQFSFNSPVLSNGDVLDLATLDATNDLDEFTIDVAAGSYLDVVLDGVSSSFAEETIELVDPENNVVATGSTMPLGTTGTNFDQAIIDYEVVTSGVHTVRLAAAQTATYALVVSEDLAYDLESNNTAGASSRSLDNVDGALGFLFSSTEDDIYSFDVAANENLIFETNTPFDDPGNMPSNGLDPQLSILDASGNVLANDANSADGKNALLSFTASDAGTYYVAVSSEAGEGEYVLMMDADAVIDGDFNDDGAHDCLDIDALTVVVASSTNDAAFDLTGDGLVNLDDRDAWLAEAAAANGFNSPYFLGDVNLDGTNDGADFVIWNANKFTDTTAYCSGDINMDGTVDGGDFVQWNANKFQSNNVELNLGHQSEIDVAAPVLPPEVAPPRFAAADVRLAATADSVFATYVTARSVESQDDDPKGKDSLADPALWLM